MNQYACEQAMSSSRITAHFQGIWVPMVTPLRSGELDLDAAQRLASDLATSGIDGLVVCGTTGEAAMLAADEQSLLLDSVLEAVGPRFPVVMGVGGSDTRQVTATVQRYSFVTFHQSYGYEEFVEGLRPVLNGDAEAGEVEYEIRPGAFKELCRKARQAPDQRFAMVIDEINRGNISKILGELITLIEPDKRDPQDGSKPPIELTLAYSGEKFSVPANVDIIGTMNTADRSLALLDTALRRRFDFVPLLPDTRAVKVPDEPHSAPLAGLVVTTDAGEIDVRRLLERINERIEALYDRDHCIGHAYFTHLWRTTDGAQRFEALADTFRNRVLPLLEEYFFEDWRKIRLVLGDNQKPDAAQFITESGAHEQALSDLFGDDHGLDSYTTQRRHQLQASAFANPAAYLGIYQPLA